MTKEQKYVNKLSAIDNLLKMFKMERVVYLIVTVISFFVLLGSATYLLFIDCTSSLIVYIGMFGSSGAIAFTSGRLLRMWRDAMQFLMDIKENGKDE